MFALSKTKQLNIFEQISELKSFALNQPVGFISLLAENFDIETFIPDSFTNHYYSTLGRNRSYKLSSILSALILMQIFHIPTTVLLNLFLVFSTEIRDFCGFYTTVPDESFFSRFKVTFEKDIANLFNELVPTAIDICEKINDSLPNNSPYKNLNSMLIYDTSGLKPKVKENNPKTLVSEINKQKSYAKVMKKENFNPYAAAYKNMPKSSQANPNIRLYFVNGHFGYFYKFGLLTNGLGIPLGINFFEEDFYNSFTETFNTPEEQKYVYDNASLKPVIIPFLESLKSSTNFKFTSFLGDSEFDSYDNFGLLQELKFNKVFIPINSRNQKNNKVGDLEFNNAGIPLCPITKEPFKAEGSCGGKNRSQRFKFTCPKSHRDKFNKTYHTCETPCTNKKSGRMTYVYPNKNFRLYPGIIRNSQEWVDSYKIRASIERTIACFKFNPCIQSPNTVNTITMRSDLYLTGISKLINVILAHALNNPDYIRTTRKILKLAM